jgi:hypothetical protein
VWFIYAKCNFYTQNVISTRKVCFLHEECDLYTQSVIYTRNVMLKRTNVITTLPTVISTYTRLISTRRVWCWHVWVWLWHSYVLKPHSVYDVNPYTVMNTRTSVISERKVWFQDFNTHQCDLYICRVRFPQVECNFYTQSDIKTNRCDYDTHDCDFNTHKNDSYTQSVILTRMSGLRHARVSEFQLDTCDCKTNQLKLS